MKNKTPFLIIFLWVLLTSNGFNRELSGDDILQKVVQKYKNMETFQCKLIWQFEIKKDVIKTEFSLTIRRPNKIALKMESGDSGASLFSNGEKYWIYFPQGNTYMEKEEKFSFSSPITKFMGGYTYFFGGQPILFKLFAKESNKLIKKMLKKIKYIGKEKIGEENLYHLVIEGKSGSKIHLWIDTWNYIIKKIVSENFNKKEFDESKDKTKKENSGIKFIEEFINCHEPEKINKDIFYFTPPKGATKNNQLFNLLSTESMDRFLKKGKPKFILTGFKKIWHKALSSSSIDTGCFSEKNKLIFVSHSIGNIGIYDFSGNQVSQLSIPKHFSYIQKIDWNNDKISELLLYKSWGDSLTLIDKNGKILWEFSEGQGINDVCVYDINNDQKPEIIIGYNGGTGVYALNCMGKVIWKYTDIGNVWHVTVGDLEGDGQPEVITTSAKGKIYVFSAKGQLKKKIKRRKYIDFVKVVEFIKSNPGPEIVIGGSKKKSDFISVLDKNWDQIWEVDIGDKHISQPETVTCLPENGLLTVGTMDGRVLVFDEKGNIKARAGNFGRGIPLKWVRLKDKKPLLITGSLLKGLMALELNNQMITSNKKVKENVIFYHLNGRKRLVYSFKKMDNTEIIIKKTEFNDKGKPILIEDLVKKTRKEMGYFKNGNINYLNTFKNDKPDGIWKTWHINGKLRRMAKVSNGNYHGKYEEWDKEGILIGEGKFRNGNGRFVSWYKNGQKQTEIVYKMGNGIYLEWYKNGIIKKENHFKGLQKHGREIYWYESGKKEFQCEYFDGEYNGTVISYYKNGGKHREMEFSIGIAQGLYADYYENGQKHLKSQMVDGKTNGLVVLWYKSGLKKRECFFKNEIPHGKWIEWDENGKVTKEVIYSDGEILKDKKK